MDVLLINPGKVRHDYVSEHLGIASLKAYTQQKGFEVDTVDMAIESLSVADGIDKILEINPQVVGFSLLDDSRFKGLDIIKGIRRAGYQGAIIVGGYFASFAAEELLRDFQEIDFVVRGEGELTLAELLEKIIRQSPLAFHKIQGLSFREKNQIVHNTARPLIADLDFLPPVDRKYARVVLERGFHLRIAASRGCWGQCTFCDIIGMYRQSPGKIWRSRSIKNVVDEIEQLVQSFNTQYFAFNDDQFLLPGKKGEERAEALAAELERRNLKIQFELMCRVDTVSSATMRRLKSAGLQRVFLGLESFNQKQLDRLQKGVSIRQNLKALITLYRLEIDVIASVILSDAFTSLREVIDQFFILVQLRRRYFNSRRCQISINQKIEIYRGSLIYQQYKQQGLLSRDHYLDGYDYHLKLGTYLRLKLFDLEASLSRFIRKPLVSLRNLFRAIRWWTGQLARYLEYER